MCGKKNINLNSKDINQINNVTVPYGLSCFYKIETECGYPNITLNHTEYDIAVTMFEMSDVDKNINDYPSISFPLRPNETWSSNLLTLTDKKNISFKQPGEVDGSETTCGKRRVMLVTLSNFQTPKTQLE